MKYSYEKVKDYLCGIIEKSESGSLLPSEYDLCGTLQVSRVTVRTALAQLEEEHLIIRKKGKGSFVPEKNGLTSRNNIVVMSPYVNDDASPFSEQLVGSFHGKIISGIFEQAGISRTRLHIIPLEDSLQLLIREIEQCRADAVMLVVPNKNNWNIVEGLRKYHKPVMLVNRIDRKNDFNYVSADYAGGSENAIRFLVDKGHKRIAFLGLDRKQPHILERYEGYMAAMAKTGTDFSEIEPFEMDVDAKKPYNVQALSKEITDYLKKYRPTAVLASTSTIIEEVVLPVINGIGKRIPDDLEVITFDELLNTIPEKPFIHEIPQPSLVEMGRMAMWCMERIISGNIKKSEHLIPLSLDRKEL